MSVAGEIKALAGRAFPIDCDVSQRDQVDRAVAAAVDAFGPIDILVNNAQAIPLPKPLQEWSENDMNLMWASGPMGTWHFMVACLPHMKNRDGRIINTCSGAGHGYLEGYAGYAAAKEAIRSLTRTAAHEWGQFNIHVNVIAPAAKTASMMNAIDAKKREMILERFPLKRFGARKRHRASCRLPLRPSLRLYDGQHRFGGWWCRNGCVEASRIGSGASERQWWNACVRREEPLRGLATR